MAFQAIPALFPFEEDDILIREFSGQLVALLVGAIVRRVIPVCLLEVK
jgi:hypothetical protein